MATWRVAVIYLVGLEYQATGARVRQSWSTVRKFQTLIHQHRPGERGSGTAVLTGPQALQSGAALRGMRAAYHAASVFSAASDIAACGAVSTQVLVRPFRTACLPSAWSTRPRCGVRSP